MKKDDLKYKVGFIYICEGNDPRSDRSVIDSRKMILYTVGVANYDEAEIVAEEMLKDGCAAIDLCGAFGNQGVARISKAVNRKIPVGCVNFDFHPIIREKSGDDLFQKDFWCTGL